MLYTTPVGEYHNLARWGRSFRLCPQVQSLQALLTERGYRVTSQRLGIYEYLLSCKSHPTADQIYKAVRRRFPMISLATVYRTLELLSRLGLVTQLGLAGQRSRYDGNPKVHVNLLCKRCQRIEDLEEV